MLERNTVDATKFNPAAKLPYELRLKDFEVAFPGGHPNSSTCGHPKLPHLSMASRG